MPDLAFVLLRQAVEPQPAPIISAARRYGLELMPHGQEMAGGGLAFDLTDGAGMVVSLMPGPDPDLAGMPTGVTSPPPEDLAASRAHLIVGVVGLTGDDRGRDTLLAMLTAAVVDSTDAVAAKLGHGEIYHRAGIFADAAKLSADHSESLPVEVAVDVTAAQESATHMSFLTHGLARYGREELYVTCPVEGTGALSFVYTIARWMVDDPTISLPTGDTVGRDENEKIVVARVPSPTGGGPDVIRLDLP